MSTTGIDWNQVKKQTLWGYEDLIKKLVQVLAYDFVQTRYDHTMQQAARYAGQVQKGYLQNKSDTALCDSMIACFKRLDTLKVKSYGDLIRQVETREKCAAFLHRTGLGFDDLVQTLNYLFRWVLPFAIPARELMDMDDKTQKAYLAILKQHNLSLNLDLLEQGRTRAGRTRLARATGIPAPFILALVHRADISRLAYVRGKTIRHLCGGGYDTLDKIAGADVEKMEKDMEAYYGTLGKSLADFKSVIPLSWMIGGARILPRVVRG
jgi:Domain of unknown function (DUF4332)